MRRRRAHRRVAVLAVPPQETRSTAQSSMVAQSGSSSPTPVLHVLCAVLATKKGPAEAALFGGGDPKYAKLEPTFRFH